MRTQVFVDNISKSYPLQTSFGEGIEGGFINGYSFSWGDPIFLRSGAADVTSGGPYAITAKNSKQTYDHAAELYRSAVSTDLGITLQGGDEWGDYYLDMDQLFQQGIIKANSDLKRSSAKANVSRKFTEDFTIRVNANYIKSLSDRIQQGSNISGLLLGAYRTPPDFNNSPYLVNYTDPSTGVVYPNVQRSYRDPTGNPTKKIGYDNPLYVINQIPTTFNTERFLGSVDMSYDPAKWLNITFRNGIDSYTENRSTSYPFRDAAFSTGFLSREVIGEYQINSDLMGTITQKFSDDFNSSLLVGFHLDNHSLNDLYTQGTQFLITNGLFAMQNCESVTSSEYYYTMRTAALYGELKFGIYDQLFLTMTGRNESASTYGANVAKTYFYPSANLAWQFTQLPDLKDDATLSYGKLRVAYGTAANQPSVFQTDTYYPTASTADGWGATTTLLDATSPLYNGGIQRSSVLGNADLKPEMTAETEFGGDFRFFSDRTSLNLTQYYSKTTDAILPMPIAPTGGFTSEWANAATIENRGTEVQLTIDWLHTGGFSWSSTINWSKNKNEVTSMPAGVSSIFLAGFEDPSSRAILNQPVGVLWGTRWDRNANGSIKLDANGFPIESETDGIIGDPNPDWRSSIVNTFRYERLSLNVVFDIKKGGKVWNGTKGALYYFGTHADLGKWTTVSATTATTVKDYEGMTVADLYNFQASAVTKNTDGSYSFRGYINNFGGGPVVIDEFYYWDGPGSGFTGPSEQFIEDGGWVRLKEVTLAYTFPLQFMGLQNATVSVTGRNLVLWSNYTGIDPETNLTGPTNGQGLDYFNNPTTKTWVFSLKFDY